MILLLFATLATAAPPPRVELQAEYAIGAYSLSQVALDGPSPLAAGSVTGDPLRASGGALRARGWLGARVGAELRLATAGLDGSLTPTAGAPREDAPSPLMGGGAAVLLRRPILAGALALEPAVALGASGGRVTVFGTDPRTSQDVARDLWTAGPTASAELTLTAAERVVARGAAGLLLPPGPVGTTASLSLGGRVWSGLHVLATATAQTREVRLQVAGGDGWAEAGTLSDQLWTAGLGVMWRR